MGDSEKVTATAECENVRKRVKISGKVVGSRREGGEEGE